MFFRKLALASALLLIAGGAHAVAQYTPTGTDLLHLTTDGPPGAEWNTAGVSQGLSYDSGSGILTLTAVLDVLNYWDPANGSCSVNTSNCSFDFGVDSVGPDLDIVLDMALTSVTATGSAAAFALTFEFGTTGGTDLLVTDAADGGSTQLSGNLLAGTFGGTPTDGLQASILVVGGVPVFDSANSVGVLDITGGPLASLFGSTQMGIQLATFDSFSPTLAALVAGFTCAPTAGGTECDISELASFTAEGTGQVYRTDTGQFVPEPSTWLMLGTGLVGLLAVGRRRAGSR